MVKPKYPDVKISINIYGQLGNAYYILGRVEEDLRKAGVNKKEIAEYIKDAQSGDYQHLLQVTSQWVDFDPSGGVLDNEDDYDD